MAFPVVESITADNATGGAASGGNTAAASHDLTLPATISAGALLLIVGRVAGAGTVAVSGGGWTIVQDDTDASDDVSFWMYRDTAADGTEDGSSITVTHGSFKMVAIAMSITGASAPGTQAPQSSTVAVGTGSNPGPTACTPTGGAKDYLWIAVGLADGEHTSPPTTIPADYGSSAGSGSGTGGLPATNVRAYTATRNLNAASEDPGTWTTSVAVNAGWTSWALAVHPVGVTDHTRTPADTLSLADALGLGPGKGLADTLALADTQGLGAGKGLAETVALADGLALAPNIALADTLALDDLADPQLTEGGVEVVVRVIQLAL